MSLRGRAVVLVGIFIALVLIWFLFLWRPNQNRIAELRSQQDQSRQEIGNLRQQVARLEALREQAPQLQADLGRIRDALPDEPRLPDFILQVHEAASLAGIDFISITPALPSAFTPPGTQPGAAPAPAEGGQLQAITVSVATAGTFFEIEDFIVRLERLGRAVRINSFALAPGGAAATPAVPGASPTLSVTFQIQMFLVSRAPVAPGATPGSTPGATPAPAGATPTPTPAPGTGPAASPTPSPG